MLLDILDEKLTVSRLREGPIGQEKRRTFI